MDTTSSTSGGREEVWKNDYVSCIKIDGKPILPPLMTAERREEMRRYRDLAILKEKRLREISSKRLNNFRTEDVVQIENEITTINTDNQFRESPVRRSSSVSPIFGVPATSTPRIPRIYKCGSVEVSNEDSPVDVSFSSSSIVNGTEDGSGNVPEGVLRERKIVVPSFDLNSANRDSVDQKFASASDSDENERRSSLASSTATFVIHKFDDEDKDNIKFETNEHYTSEDEVENDENIPPTVLRKSPLPLETSICINRQKPIKYFDLSYLEDDGKGAFNERKITIPVIPHVDMNKSSTLNLSARSPATSATYEGDVDKNASTSESDDNEKEGVANLSTVTSSTDTFVVQKSDTSNIKAEVVSVSDTNEQNLRTSEDESSSDTSAPATVLRGQALEEPVFKRRRPTKYFDVDDQCDLSSVDSVASISLYSNIPNSVQSTEVGNERRKSSISGTSSFSPVASTNFTAIAKSITNELTHKIGSILNTPSKKERKSSIVGGSYDVMLSKDIPSSAEKRNSPIIGKSDDGVNSLLAKIEVEHQLRLRQLEEKHHLQQQQIAKEFENEIEKLREKQSLNSSLDASNSGKLNFKKSLVENLNSSARCPTRPVTAESSGSVLLSEETVNSSRTVTSGMSGLSISELTKCGRNSVFQFSGNSISNSRVLPTVTDLTGVNLSKLQSRMQLMSPSLFRIPSDARSPLLKGLVFPNPLDRPAPPRRIPSKAFEKEMQPKFDHLSACIKGHLTRRLLKTERVQIIVQTIRDTVELLLSLYEEQPMVNNKYTVKEQDADLHLRLIQQLTGACQSFHDVFFKLSTKERMAIIASDREKIRSRMMRLGSPSKPGVSNATLKSMERRMGQSLSLSTRPSVKRDRKSRSSTRLCDQTYVTQSRGASSYHHQPNHDTTFKVPNNNGRMSLSTNDRDKLKVKNMNARNVITPRRNVSNATLKSLERRMSQNLQVLQQCRTPMKRDSSRKPQYTS